MELLEPIFGLPRRLADDRSLGDIPELKAVAAELAKTMGCNCDLDNWEPERSTGHSCVCRIHKAAIAKHFSR